MYLRLDLFYYYLSEYQEYIGDYVLDIFEEDFRNAVGDEFFDNFDFQCNYNLIFSQNAVVSNPIPLVDLNRLAQEITYRFSLDVGEGDAQVGLAGGFLFNNSSSYESLIVDVVKYPFSTMKIRKAQEDLIDLIEGYSQDIADYHDNGNMVDWMDKCMNSPYMTFEEFIKNDSTKQDSNIQTLDIDIGTDMSIGNLPPKDTRIDKSKKDDDINTSAFDSFIDGLDID